MVRFPVTDLQVQASLSQDLYLDDQFLLLPSEVPLPADLRRDLQDLGITELFITGDPSKLTITTSDQAAAAIRAADFDMIPPPSFLVGKTPAELLEICQQTYEKLCSYCHNIYVGSVENKTINRADLESHIGRVIDYVVANRRLVIHVPMLYDGLDGESRQVHHSVHATILSILIGVTLGLPKPNLIELGTAAILHELGMFFLAGDLYRKEEHYLPMDKKELMRHPNIAGNLLVAAGFSPAVINAVLQHHERENGSGYPQGIPGMNISLYGKILAVACAYDGSASNRPYRGLQTPHMAIASLLDNSTEGKHLFDNRIVRVLVTCLSFWPIGSIVALSDDRPCRVIEVNPKDPRAPIIALLTPDFKDGKLLIPDNVRIQIDREMTREDVRKYFIKHPPR
jgi:HD-GYP domain-containing protein (c-di-GMP phosphodiesterase class II)